MTSLTLTRHANERMRQRGYGTRDIDLIFGAATQVADDAFVLTARDAAREIARRKREIQQLERLRGSKLVVVGNTVITLYHAARMPRRSRAAQGRRSS